VFVIVCAYLAGGIAGEAAGSDAGRSAKNRKSNTDKGDRQDKKTSEAAGLLAV
jgi:hypothetical protein